MSSTHDAASDLRRIHLRLTNAILAATEVLADEHLSRQQALEDLLGDLTELVEQVADAADAAEDAATTGTTVTVVNSVSGDASVGMQIGHIHSRRGFRL